MTVSDSERAVVDSIFVLSYLSIERNLHTFNFELLIFAKIKSIQGFCFGIEVVKNSEGACVFCTVLIWGAKPPL